MVMLDTHADARTVEAARAQALTDGEWWLAHLLELAERVPGVVFTRCLVCDLVHTLQDSAFCSLTCEQQYRQRYSRAYARAAGRAA